MKGERHTHMEEIFDDWPGRYEQWFKTPIGTLVKEYENELIMEMLDPRQGEEILDAGCGTGIFTLSLLVAGAYVTGLEISLPMLLGAKKILAGYPFRSIQGDMTALPFLDHTFDKVISVTAIEFIEDAGHAIGEAFRVTKPGGCIVVATLNGLSPWATRRKEAGEKGHPLFRHAIFRSPREMGALSPAEGTIRTAVHFQKDHAPNQAKIIERKGRLSGLSTGAFLVGKWVKPHE